MAAQSFFFYLLFIGVSFVFLSFVDVHGKTLFTFFFMVVVRMQTKNYDRKERDEKKIETNYIVYTKHVECV